MDEKGRKDYDNERDFKIDCGNETKYDGNNPYHDVPAKKGKRITLMKRNGGKNNGRKTEPGCRRND